MRPPEGAHPATFCFLLEQVAEDWRRRVEMNLAGNERRKVRLVKRKEREIARQGAMIQNGGQSSWLRWYSIDDPLQDLRN